MEFSFFDGDSPETPPIVLHSWGTGTDKGDKAVYKVIGEPVFPADRRGLFRPVQRGPALLAEHVQHGGVIERDSQAERMRQFPGQSDGLL